jgi:hypothetical protein
MPVSEKKEDRVEPAAPYLPAAERASTAAGPDGRRGDALCRNALSESPRMVSQRRALGEMFGVDTAQLTSQPAREELPGTLKTGIESLSGVSMDGVSVHRNSPRPAAIGALAYAQGREIHLGPGQEKHLPHEAWHVVQQQQHRVAPTTQVAGTAVNDDVTLEREADTMGGRAAQ